MSQQPTQHEITPEQRAFAEAALYSMPLIRSLGFRLDDIAIDTAVISVEMHDDLKQPGGLLHGGVTATLIDTAMAFAVRTRVEPEVRTATIDLTIHYVRPLTEGRAICTATVVRSGRRIFTVSAEVHNESGKLIATGLSTYTKI